MKIVWIFHIQWPRWQFLIGLLANCLIRLLLKYDFFPQTQHLFIPICQFHKLFLIFFNCSPENSCMHYNLVGWNDKLGTILSDVCLFVKCHVIIHYTKARNAWDFSVLLVNVSKHYILFVYGVWTLMGIWASLLEICQCFFLKRRPEIR